MAQHAQSYALNRYFCTPPRHGRGYCDSDGGREPDGVRAQMRRRYRRCRRYVVVRMKGGGRVGKAARVRLRRRVVIRTRRGRRAGGSESATSSTSRRCRRVVSSSPYRYCVRPEVVVVEGPGRVAQDEALRARPSSRQRRAVVVVLLSLFGQTAAGVWST